MGQAAAPRRRCLTLPGGLLSFFLMHGVAWMSGPLGAMHLPACRAYGVYMGEVIALIFLILGLWMRIAALLVAFNMGAAIFLDAWPLALTINRGNGWGIEREAFYFLTALAVVSLGAGRYSVSRGKGRLG